MTPIAYYQACRAPLGQILLEGAAVASPSLQVQRLLHLRRLTDWSPVIVVAVLSSDQLHLALVLATALSVGNMLADLIFKSCGYIKVRLPGHAEGDCVLPPPR